MMNELVHSPLPLTNSKGFYSGAQGEFALMARLLFARDARRLPRLQAEARWEIFEPLELQGQTLGILGDGDIGRAAAQRARADGVSAQAGAQRGGRTGG